MDHPNINFETVPYLIETEKFKVFDLCFESHPCIIQNISVDRTANFICRYCLKNQITIPDHFSSNFLNKRYTSTT